MDPAIRARVARALQGAQAVAAPGALYAIWLCGEELVSLAQPRAPSHRLDSRDLLLLVNFVATQPALRNAESWTPVCFPRFQEKVTPCHVVKFEFWIMRAPCTFYLVKSQRNTLDCHVMLNLLVKHYY